jgi:thiol reductant ABC exporter CydC subunit
MTRVFWRILKLVAPIKKWMALAVLLGLATIGSSIGLMATAAFIIAKAALHPSIADLQVAIVGVRFFGIARGGLRYLERLISHNVTFRLLARLRVWLYSSLEPLAPAWLADYRSGDLLSRAVADIETLEHFFGRVLAPPIVAALVGLLMALWMGHYDRWLAITLFVFLAAGGIGLPLFTWRLHRGTGRRMVQIRAELNNALVDGVQGMPELLVFGQAERHQRHIRHLNHRLAVQQRRTTWVNGLHTSLMGLMISLATLAVLLLTIPLVNEGRLAGVQLAVIILAVIASFEAVAPLPEALQHLESSLVAAGRLFEIVDATPAAKEPRSPSPAPQDFGLLVQNLTFRYHPQDPPALEGITFSLPAGGRIAIVGPSGAGKSTLAGLLLRFWDYERGEILLGGHPIKDYHQSDVSSLIAVIAQQTHLFNTSVRENLLMARPAASEAELIWAAQQAGIHAFVASLPQGYDTWIGEWGMGLSAGQCQRLAIARAILQDAPMLILDEPTANLDALTERDVMGALLPLIRQRTALIITHRLVGLGAFDQILVLESGRIVERGRHEALLKRGGLYYHMWELQNQVLAETLPA